MLNISKKSISDKISKNDYSSFQRLANKSISYHLPKFILGVLLLFIISLFAPWTQNIRSKGYVTTLSPTDRPQSIQSLIDGRIDKWFVREGDVVSIGDTILIISESKEDYFDPDILERTEGQIAAKSKSSEAYATKALNLENQVKALEKNLKAKLDQNEIKIKQAFIKIQSDSINLLAAKLKYANSEKQLNRIKELYEKGIKSLTELEFKKLDFQEAEAKVISLENSLLSTNNDISNYEFNKSVIKNEFENKFSKIRADRMTALSNKFNADGSVDKLQSSFNKLKVRSENYVLRSPINGTITKVYKKGLGEIVKSGEEVLSIIPDDLDLAVEMYVKPVDVPLIKKEQIVRIQFDGWPAIIFSGWPNNSYGTFSGKVYAIDKYISENGMYRVLVEQDENNEKWPELIRVGAGTNSIILLNEVKLYYELWRKLNGFPPDFYKDDETKSLKLKAPIKKVK